jgi:single-strand DNA-binding protein
VKKGDKLYVEGRIEYRQWEDKEKQTRWSTEVVANEIILLGGRGGGPGDEARPARAAAGAKAKSGTDADGDFEPFDATAEGEDDDLPF